MQWLEAGGIMICVGFCFALYRIANGRINKKVGRDTCHAHVDSLKDKIESVDGKVDEVRKDIKSLLKYNGIGGEE